MKITVTNPSYREYLINVGRYDLLGDNMSDSELMNKLLDRLGLWDVRAIPGTLMAPTIVIVLSHLVNRIERLENDTHTTPDLF